MGHFGLVEFLLLGTDDGRGRGDAELALTELQACNGDGGTTGGSERSFLIMLQTRCGDEDATCIGSGLSFLGCGDGGTINGGAGFSFLMFLVTAGSQHTPAAISVGMGAAPLRRLPGAEG